MSFFNGITYEITLVVSYEVPWGISPTIYHAEFLHLSIVRNFPWSLFRVSFESCFWDSIFQGNNFVNYGKKNFWRHSKRNYYEKVGTNSRRYLGRNSGRNLENSPWRIPWTPEGNPEVNVRKSPGWIPVGTSERTPRRISDGILLRITEATLRRILE